MTPHYHAWVIVDGCTAHRQAAPFAQRTSAQRWLSKAKTSGDSVEGFVRKCDGCDRDS